MYSFRAEIITSVTVRPSISALSLTAVHSSLDTRMVRVGVLGALGIKNILNHSGLQERLKTTQI